MATVIDYALMAGNVYQDTRAPINWIPAPTNWRELEHVVNKDSGFEVSQFQNGTEIVISFAGTATTVDWWANVGGAFGVTSTQLQQAADYYLQIKATAPAGTTISFTGHSLGGGLASLMAVMFNETAATFDQAPFRNSATVAVANELMTYLSGKGYDLQGLSNFISSAASGGIPNESNVIDFNVQGEALGYLPFSRIGTQSDIANSSNGASTVDLHSQALLTTFLQSNQTAAAQKGLSDVTFKLPDLLKMIFDKNLFYHDPNNKDAPLPNFLEHLVQQQALVTDTATGIVTRFNNDLWKLAQNGGLTLSDYQLTSASNNLSKTLIAFAMQKYYEENLSSGTTLTELFTDLGTGSNGIRFDMADVSKTFAAITVNEKFNLVDAKGFKEYFQAFMKETVPETGAGAVQFTAAEQSLINAMLPYMRDWYVQAGASGMNATDTLNRGAFMLGGSSADTLMGGTAADLLVGNAGNDILVGGQGNDTLLGGSGNDSYVYTAGDGLDTILDTSGQNTLAVDGVVLNGGEQYGDARVHKDANDHLYVDVGQSNLIIDGNIVIQNYSSGGIFGLTLSATPVADPASTTPAIVGDLAPIDQNTVATGVQLGYDSLGNVKTDPNVAETGRADTLYGSAGNDIIAGGTGGDILSGGLGNDRLYADSQTDTASAIAQGNATANIDVQGDWLAGGDGSDTLVGGSANDVLTGGSGSDLLIAGAGNDDIMGDSNWVATNLNWSVTDQPDGTRFFYPVNSNVQPTVGGADVIYAGEGNDHVWGELGNDVIFGEGGNDVLQGGSGNDTILGGSGNDFIYGEGQLADTAGNDYLDGGAGVDVVFGNAGDDILIGGTENDTLYGGTGQDTYIFNRGDGTDTVYDIKSENNILRFGAGISSSDVTLRLGSLMLDLGNGDAIHLKNMDENGVLTDFNQNDVFNSSSVASFQFADGTTLTTTELLARGFDLNGTAGDDVVTGTNTTDRINGLGGNDTLYVSVGDAANDEINQLYRYAA